MLFHESTTLQKIVLTAMGQDVLVKAEDLEIEEDGDGVEGDGAEDGPGAYDRCAAKVLTGCV